MDGARVTSNPASNSAVSFNESSISSNEGSNQECDYGARLCLNISGQKFEVVISTVTRHPATRLAKIAVLYSHNKITGAVSELYHHYDPFKREFFFERDPTSFLAVLAYYRSGKLHIPRDICVELFMDEILFWGIPFNPSECCQGYHQQQWDLTETVRKTNELYTRRERHKSIKATLTSGLPIEQPTCFEIWKRKTWDLFEDPKSSSAAKVVSFISTMMVIISTITLCVNTHPDVAIVHPDGRKEDNPHLALVEYVCIVWFTAEYILRLISSPQKFDFLKSILNSIDVLAVLPFYVGILIEVCTGDLTDSFVDVRRFVQILRIFRIVRIFKVARHSAGLQVLGYTVKNSVSELGLLFLLLIMGMTLFSSLAYYAEEQVPGTKFESIISAFWWAIITMTTVGYGDMYPKTTLGQVIGSMCCVSGILFIALPIPTIVSNFSAYYKDHMNKERLTKLYSEEDVDDVFPEAPHEITDTIQMDGAGQSVRLSLADIRRHGNYRRRLSTYSNILGSRIDSRVHPINEEEEV